MLDFGEEANYEAKSIEKRIDNGRTSCGVPATNEGKIQYCVLLDIERRENVIENKDILMK